MAEGPDPTTDPAPQLLPWTGTWCPWTGSDGHTPQPIRQDPGWAQPVVSCFGGGSWVSGGAATLSQTSRRTPDPTFLPVLAYPALRGIKRVFPSTGEVLHWGTLMSWRRDPSVRWYFKKLGRILWTAKQWVWNAKYLRHGPFQASFPWSQPPGCQNQGFSLGVQAELCLQCLSSILLQKKASLLTRLPLQNQFTKA